MLLGGQTVGFGHKKEEQGRKEGTDNVFARKLSNISKRSVFQYRARYVAFNSLRGLLKNLLPAFIWTRPLNVNSTWVWRANWRIE